MTSFGIAKPNFVTKNIGYFLILRNYHIIYFKLEELFRNCLTCRKGNSSQFFKTFYWQIFYYLQGLNSSDLSFAQDVDTNISLFAIRFFLTFSSVL